MSGRPYRSILISGLGIAGPALAFWLRRYGFEPEIVEVAPEPRAGGYVIDIWGMGFDAIERMGFVPALRDIGYRFAEVRCLDARGRKVAGINGHTFTEALGDRYVSVLRGDLADLLFRQIYDVPVRFGDSIAALDQNVDGVDVRFASGRNGRFDLVIGADGLHSSVRRLAFGHDADFEKKLGYWVASFQCDDYPHSDPGVYVSHTRPHRQIARYALRDGRTAFLFVWTAADREAPMPHGPAEQKAALVAAFSGSHWEWPEIAPRLEKTQDLYFDAVAHVHAPSWSRGRVALIGDAASCPSLLAGEGAAMAMVGGDVLAGELSRADGDYVRGFAAYEDRLRSHFEKIQRGSLWYASQFAPKSAWSLWLRDRSMGLLALPLLGPYLARRMLSGGLALGGEGGR